jgi:hypothetical protein
VDGHGDAVPLRLGPRVHGLTHELTDATVDGELVLGTGVQGREDARKPSHPCERGAGFLLKLTRGRRRKIFLCSEHFWCGGVCDVW